MTSWATILVPLGSLTLGSVLTQVQTLITNRSQRSAARDDSSAERQRSRQDRRDAFELENLLIARDALFAVRAGTFDAFEHGNRTTPTGVSDLRSNHNKLLDGVSSAAFFALDPGIRDALLEATSGFTAAFISYIDGNGTDEYTALAGRPYAAALELIGSRVAVLYGEPPWA